MKSQQTILALILFPCTLMAEPNLVGKWISDKATSLAFARENIRANPGRFAFFEQYFGRVELTIKEKTIRQFMPRTDMLTPNGMISVDEVNEIVEYSVLGRDPNSISISVTLPQSGEKTILLYHFVDENLMWLYVPDMSGYRDAHFREYYRRVE